MKPGAQLAANVTGNGSVEEVDGAITLALSK